MENSRYKTNLADIKAFYLKLAEIIAEVPVGWLFNLDETGQQDFVYARDIHAVVPFDRCISCEAVFLMKNVLIITKRKTFDEKLLDSGITPEQGLSQFSPYC